MSTNVVAFLLLNRFRDGCTLDALVEAVDQLRQEFEWARRDVAFCGETVDIIKHAVSINCLYEIILPSIQIQHHNL